MGPYCEDVLQNKTQVSNLSKYFDQNQYVICLLCWDLRNNGVSLLLESPWWVGVHWEYGLVVFRLMMQELLNIEQFDQKTIQQNQN